MTRGWWYFSYHCGAARVRVVRERRMVRNWGVNMIGMRYLELPGSLRQLGTGEKTSRRGLKPVELKMKQKVCTTQNRQTITDRS